MEENNKPLGQNATDQHDTPVNSDTPNSFASSQPDTQQPSAAPAEPDVAPQINAPQPAQNAQSAEPAAPQGIFSSGDLAVNSENLEEIKPQLSDENKSRIASAFAQTDATQKRDQLSDQMADQDAISGTVLPAGASFGSNATASSATGDIRIPGAKKKSKFPLLALAAVVVIAVVAGGVWWAMKGEKNDETLQSLYASFMDYINNGPDGDYTYDGAANSIGDTGETAPPQSDDSEPSTAPQDDSEPNSIDANAEESTRDTDGETDNNESDRSQRFIFVADDWLSGNDLASYYAEVDARYNRFIEKARNSENQAIKTAANANYNIFPAVFTTMQLNTIEYKITQLIYSGNMAEAESYVAQLAPAESQQEPVNTMMAGFLAYLRQMIPVYEIYKQEGCLFVDAVDWGCVAELENSTAEYAILEATERLENAMSLAETYQKIVFSQLVSFGDLIKEAYE